MRNGRTIPQTVWGFLSFLIFLKIDSSSERESEFAHRSGGWGAEGERECAADSLLTAEPDPGLDATILRP